MIDNDSKVSDFAFDDDSDIPCPPPHSRKMSKFMHRRNPASYSMSCSVGTLIDLARRAGASLPSCSSFSQQEKDKKLIKE